MHSGACSGREHNSGSLRCSHRLLESRYYFPELSGSGIRGVPGLCV